MFYRKPDKGLQKHKFERKAPPLGVLSPKNYYSPKRNNDGIFQVQVSKTKEFQETRYRVCNFKSH